MLETRVWSLVWEDPTGHRATKLVPHNCWACALRAQEPQLPRPRAPAPEGHMPEILCPATREATAMRSLHTATSQISLVVWEECQFSDCLNKLLNYVIQFFCISINLMAARFSPWDELWIHSSSKLSQLLLYVRSHQTMVNGPNLAHCLFL